MAVNVFVSYSQKDRLAATLVGTLRGNRDVRVFIAHQFPSPGMSIRDKVLHGLSKCDVFLLLWSGQAAGSEWVAFEIETARKLGKRILPVLLTEDAELPAAIEDIEAVPLYKNPEAGMPWLPYTFSPPNPCFEDVRGALLEMGIDLKRLSSYARVNELRLLANCAKHGDGWSCDELRAARPELFTPSHVPDPSPWWGTLPVIAPLGGEDLYLTPEEFTKYANGVIALWDQLATMIAAKWSAA